MTNRTDLAAALRPLLTGNVAEERVRRYLKPGYFTGAWFETLADTDNPNRFTERDFAAVMMLSVTIPWPVRKWLLGPEGADAVSSLLQDINPGCHIADDVDHLARGTAAWELWYLLTTAAGMGPTRTSKLIAVKRPHIVPIHDSYVERALHMPIKGSWAKWRTFMREGRDVFGQLRAVADQAGGAHLSDLRVIDIAVWMSEHDKHLQAGEKPSTSGKSLTPDPAQVRAIDRRRHR